MTIEPSHEMISAGYKATDFAEVDVREVFTAMLAADEQHIRCCLIKEGWCPPGGPGNPENASPNVGVQGRPREGA